MNGRNELVLLAEQLEQIVWSRQEYCWTPITLSSVEEEQGRTDDSYLLC